MTKRTVVVRDPKTFTLSRDAQRFVHGDVADFPLIDDIYSIRSRLEAEPTRWFVAYVAPNSQSHGTVDPDGKDREGRVEKFIERLGFQVYWPKARRPKRVRIRQSGVKRRFKTVEIVSPVLPRYVLVRMPVKDTPFGLLTTEEAVFNGICSFVGTAVGPSYVPEAIVKAIMQREQKGEFDRVKRGGKRLFSKLPEWADIGQQVMIEDGPFASFVAIVEQHVSEGRLVVAANIFGRSTPVEMELDQLRRL